MHIHCREWEVLVRGSRHGVSNRASWLDDRLNDIVEPFQMLLPRRLLLCKTGQDSGVVGGDEGDSKVTGGVRIALMIHLVGGRGRGAVYVDYGLGGARLHDAMVVRRDGEPAAAE